MPRHLFRKQSGHLPYDTWPDWIETAAAVPVLISAAISLVQRHAVWPPTVDTLLIAIAVLPWIAEAVGYILPEWLFSVVAIVPVGIMLQDPSTIDTTPFILVMLVGEMSSRLPLRRGLVVFGGCSAAMLLAELNTFDDSYVWQLGFLFAWGIGHFMRQQVQLTSELKEAQAELASKAADEERRRIASEVHDVIAHSLTVTMLHITAARMAAERGDAGEAADALREAERLGRQSLSDIRRTVGLLGPGSGVAPPAPSAADLPGLVEDFSAAGLPVTLAIDGDVAGIPPTAGLALYRIAQESLGNAARHAPLGTIDVRLAVVGVHAVLRVRNELPATVPVPAAPPGGGHGIEGMRQRASTLDGTLTAGPAGDAWVVEATIPLRDAT